MTRSKREFLMLAHTFDDGDNIDLGSGWFMSPKMDGQRIFWDGGISRGLVVTEVPYSNTAKDYRYVSGDGANYKATGLWSRNGKVIRAPEWWLDNLPRVMLDGEAWAGPGTFQLTSSIIKNTVPDEKDWEKIKFCVFDSPPPHVIFEKGAIGSQHDLFRADFGSEVLDWVRTQSRNKELQFPNNWEFEWVNAWLIKNRPFIESPVLSILPQIHLPPSTVAATQLLESELANVVKLGGEGVMLRRGMSYWSADRSHNLLKVKKWHDAEGVVRYYVWGRATKRGSKLLGLMGTMGIEWNNKIFEISGFDWKERELRYLAPPHHLAFDLGRLQPGLRADHNVVVNLMFPIGSTVTFRYRELTEAGIPSKANYWRRSSS